MVVLIGVIHMLREHDERLLKCQFPEADPVLRHPCLQELYLEGFDEGFARGHQRSRKKSRVVSSQYSLGVFWAEDSKMLKLF